MKKQISGILLTGLTVLLLAGCSSYNQLLKSQDNELKYRKALEYYKAGKYLRSIALLEDVSTFYMYSNQSDSVAYYLAASYYKQGDFEMSGTLFDKFRKEYAGGSSPFLEDAEYMYAMGFYYSTGPSNRDQTATNYALIAIDEYLSRYPGSTKKEDLKGYIAELTGKLHDKAFINAREYYTIGRYKSAVVALKNALAKYPYSNHREEILYLTAKSNYMLAFHSMEHLQRDRYLSMMDDYYTFVSEFPESKHRPELEKMQADAKAYLSKFGDGENAGKIEEQAPAATPAPTATPVP